MNDIELIPNGNGTYDWHFSNGDVVPVNGVASLRNSVIHAVQLHVGELNQQIYQHKGTHAYNYVKAKDSSTNHDYIREALTATIKELPNVYDATVEVSTTGTGIAISNITITREDGTEVVIGAV